ncbi:MAG: DUF736 family protein [Bdellovibrionales bacterium]
MIIGTFHSAEDGFAGRLYGMGLDNIPIAIIPLESGKSYAVLIAGENVNTSIEIGKARRCRGENGGYLDVRIDCPILPAAVKARMKLKPSREGVYQLEWIRDGRQ